MKYIKALTTLFVRLHQVEEEILSATRAQDYDSEKILTSEKTELIASIEFLMGR